MKLTMGEFRRLTADLPDECPFSIAAWEDDTEDWEDGIEIDRVDIEEDAAAAADSPARWLFTLWVNVNLHWAKEIQAARQDVDYTISQLERALGTLKNLG